MTSMTLGVGVSSYDIDIDEVGASVDLKHVISNVRNIS